MYVNEDSPMSRKARRDGVDVLVEGANILIKANKGILTTILIIYFLIRCIGCNIHSKKIH